MSGKHSIPPRGLTSTKSSPLFEGRFGRMFRSLPAGKFGATDDESIAKLTALASKMIGPLDLPKDGKDDEESGTPALYTYFAQFVDHDITFDPASSLQKQDDPDALTDFRTPAFDLDNVYGRGPDDQPYLYNADDTFILGSQINGGAPGAKDLPRDSGARHRAIIGDPRNDENTIVSQFQGLFLRFHNRVLAENPGKSFEHIQKLVRFHYQYVVLNDFLPKIVHSSVLADLKTNGRFDEHKLKFFHWKHEPFMPVEFSVAAYRLGHSMVRPGYRLNDSDATLLPIFPIKTPPPPNPTLPEGLTGFRPMNLNWGIDWSRFIDIDIRTYDGSPDENKKRLQFAYRIDTSIVFPLGVLPPVVAAAPSSLPLRNLERGFRMGLPTGQGVAHAMDLTPLTDDKILIGQGIDNPDPGSQVGITTIDPVFKENCPLWTYILAEAMQHVENVTVPVKGNVSITTPRLGPVGGRIVAEVFLGLMFGDNHSLLSRQPHWVPHLPDPKNPKVHKAVPDYGLKDFVNYALGNPPLQQ